ncbi:MAG TPA: hypothetical protein DCM86_14000 [Verrucomicrobiales bacterium]|nr:hypothetical protein [Verrucomicrobiales bacterium]
MLRTFHPLRFWMLSLCAGAALPASHGEILPPGHRPLPLDAHALTHARIVLEPGRTLTNATLLLRRGRIEGVGTNLTLPPDARVWDLQGAIIYPGLIEPHLVQSTAPVAAVSTTRTTPIDGSSAADSRLTSGGGIRFFGVPGEERDPGNPGAGYELAGITPERRIADRYAPDAKVSEDLRDLGFTTACVVPEKGILRGQSAFVSLAEGNPNDLLLRQDLFQHIAFDTETGKEGGYPKSLMGVIAAWRQAFFDAQHYGAEEAAYRNRPTELPRPAVNPSLAALQPAVARQQRVVIEPGSVLMMDRAARIARELGLDYTLVASGQEWRRPDLMKEVGGTFIVPLLLPAPPKFGSEEDWHQVSLDLLRAWDWAPENPALLVRKGITVALTTHGLSDRSEFRKNLRRALDRGLSETDALAALTTIPARLCAMGEQLGTIAPGKLANLMVVDGTSYFDPESRVREVWIDGRPYPTRNDPPSPPKAAEKKESPRKTQAKGEALRDVERIRVARDPMAGRGPVSPTGAVLIENATLWTSAQAGRIDGGSILVITGKLAGVGRDLPIPAELGPRLQRINASGRHLTPGIIDAHSHSMILGDVNEMSLPSTAMVRIGDVLNSETLNLHQQLAGGVTTANELHGSANPIGGQNAIIKLREGAGPEGLRFEGAPAGIKFALGENVKQGHIADRSTTRFPQTRMGVRTFYVNRFSAARQYLEAWREYRARGGAPPRRDLELEALGEILEGKRWIHCHSYRQDEILAFLRTMEDFGVQVGTLQHVLEGYKVADEIAHHGAGASCFSDWWAYKFEVYDAIPYAGALMHQRGVVVSFNSDSSDLARRLNIEAAKAVKYGGLPEEEALKFVTLNPARQLRIDSRVGSLEVGKDADFVLWSGSPLDSTSRCEQTWIDGRKYFDRQEEDPRSTELAAERAALIEKARKVAGDPDAPAPSEGSKAAFFRTTLEMEGLSSRLQCQDCQLPHTHHR